MRNFTTPLVMLQYFRDSLADADLFDWSGADAHSIVLEKRDLIRGKLSDLSGFAFKDQDAITVIVCPFKASSKISHQSLDQKKCFPILIRALLTLDGQIIPLGTSPVWVPRTYLEPSFNDSLTLGHMDRVDEFLTKKEAPSNWPELLDYCSELLDHVCEMPFKTFLENAAFVIDERVLVTPSTQLREVNKRLIEVYDALIKSKLAPGLLKCFVRTGFQKPEPSDVQQDNKLHLGQFNRSFALSESQRIALHYHLKPSPNNLCAVSGPPGTGKTTLIQSVIATRRVGAALNRENAPIIVGTSTNNLAILNILTSLAPSENTFERWLLYEGDLPVKSFGVYIPSDSRAKEAPTTDVPQFELGNPLGCTAAFVFSRSHSRLAQDYFLGKCRDFFKTRVASLESARELVHKQLKSTHESYLKILALIERYNELVFLELDRRMETLVKRRADFFNNLKSFDSQYTQWTSFPTLGYLFSEYFRLLRPIRQWRKAKLSSFCLQQNIPVTTGDDEEIAENVEQYLKSRKDQLNAIRIQLTQEETECHSLIEERDRLLRDYTSFRNLEENADALPERLSELCADINKSSDLNSWLDKNLRCRMFMWSTRYFEATFLIRSLNRNTVLTRQEEIDLLAHVFPCMVITFHTAPNLFCADKRFLYEKIDLLIVDEGGQALVEIAGPILSFSKEGLILGDDKQLEPVRKINSSVDKGNLIQRHVIAKPHEFESAEVQSSCSSQGNLLSAASYFSPKNQLGHLPMLLEHRRCVPSIITFCNELAYEGALKCMRREVERAPWPSFAYAHFEGRMFKLGSSLCNRPEAAAIAEWLKKHEQSIKTHFRCEALTDAVAILTPFNQQSYALKDECKRAGINLEKIGTVHVMQGAERPLVLFSPVYDSTHVGGLTFDRGVNMLNVAVSRARDHFVVIGNMQHFDPQRRTPSAQLSKFLFAHANNELLDVEPFKRNLGLTEQSSIRTLERHREVLQLAFRRAKKKLCIVSPFLTTRAMEEDAIFEEAELAAARGVEIIIYFDPFLTSKTTNSAQLALIQRKLSPHAMLIPADRTHAKLIAIDEAILVEGSFNWLSASRDPGFARYEISHIYKDKSAAGDVREILAELKLRQRR